MKTSLLHIYIPASAEEPAEEYDEFTCCDCGLTNRTADYAGEPSLLCECGQVVEFFSEEFLQPKAA